MAAVVSIHEILQDRTTFPDIQLLAILIHVGEGRNATIWVDVEVPLLFLLVLKKLDRAYLVASKC